jgi:hypothetical protein
VRERRVIVADDSGESEMTLLVSDTVLVIVASSEGLPSVNVEDLDSVGNSPLTDGDNVGEGVMLLVVPSTAIENEMEALGEGVEDFDAEGLMDLDSQRKL